MMLTRKHGCSPRAHHLLPKEFLSQQRNLNTREGSYCDRGSPKKASKIHIRHLSSLLQKPHNTEKYVQKREKNISFCLSKETKRYGRRQFNIRRGQSSMGKMACEDTFAYHDWVRKNRELNSLRSIGRQNDRGEKEQKESSIRRFSTENEDKDKTNNEKLEKKDQITLKQEDVQSKLKVEPITLRERLNRKRYRDLSARQLIYDDEDVQEEIPRAINTSIQQAIDRLLNRNRAVTQGSIYPNTRW